MYAMKKRRRVVRHISSRRTEINVFLVNFCQCDRKSDSDREVDLPLFSPAHSL